MHGLQSRACQQPARQSSAFVFSLERCGAHNRRHGSPFPFPLISSYPAAPPKLPVVPIGGRVNVLHEQELASADSLRIPLLHKLIAYLRTLTPSSYAAPAQLDCQVCERSDPRRHGNCQRLADRATALRRVTTPRAAACGTSGAGSAPAPGAPGRGPGPRVTTVGRTCPKARAGFSRSPGVGPAMSASGCSTAGRGRAVQEKPGLRPGPAKRVGDST